MDVPLNPDLQAKLIRLAAHQGRASEVQVVEAVERLVNYDEWFLREVGKGLAAAARGREHSDLRKMIDERYPGSYESAARTLGFAISRTSPIT